ncbi:MAG: GEVED domain-containing protein, partial [Bacteroidales bacterium]|nr:GEVED domain-containing protein [Bacteroidales bacterium]
MNKFTLVLVLSTMLLIAFTIQWGVSNGKRSKQERSQAIDSRIDNLDYWVKKAEKGIIPFNPEVKALPARYTGSKLLAFGVLTEDSPDVPVTTANSTQSENSVFVDPNNPETVINSNNSTQNPVGNLYGANDIFSFDSGENWEGEVEGTGGDNSGDPTTAIGLNGRWYINYIDNSGGMGVSYSDNQGTSWTTKTVAPNPGDLADKNHMWIDNNSGSPFSGNVYVAWTEFGGADNTEIAVSVSNDDGITWSSKKIVSEAINAGSHNQGVNLSVGPNGEVYAVWAVYDSWPSDESAIGMSKSLDGGITWDPAVRIISNIRGVRTSGTGKNMRVNSFPSATVDISNGANRGNIYITWTNIGIPGINTGNDIDVYIISSSDMGDTWSETIKVNQDESGHGKKHYFPWIVSDPSNGILSVIFYDDREVSSTELEVFCANSDDGGLTWEDFKVSDVAFTPAPIPGLAGSYFGDYLGITSQDGWVYPVWTDNRSGSAMGYCSPYQLNPLNKPINLDALLTFETGVCDLIWTYEEAEGFLHFNLYRDDVLISTTTDTTFADALSDYGFYNYKITAAYTEDRESGASRTSIQWGDAHIDVSPLSLYEHLKVDSQSVKTIRVINTGQLDLNYTITPMVVRTKNVTTYCDATGGGSDEYIARVQVGDIDHSSGQENYGDFTSFATTMMTGDSYPIIVTNGDPIWDVDECRAWIDWNQDGEFSNDEKITFDGSPGVGPYTGVVTPPISAVPGSTRMRVIIAYSTTPEPCESYSWGEVEDYTINVQGWLSVNPTVGNIARGDTAIILVGFDATGLAEGSYFAQAQFFSNDPLLPEVIVPIQLDVSSLVVVVGTIDSLTNICIGSETQLIADPYGSGDNLLYSWSSVPEGFESSEQNPVIFPENNAWYIVVATNEIDTATDSIYITVVEYPTVELGQDTTLCGINIILLDAGNTGSTYLWSTGETAQTIVAEGTGINTIWVNVTNETGCLSSDTIQLNFATLPEVNLGQDTVFCGGGSITLDAGNQGSTYLWSNGATTQTIMV